MAAATPNPRHQASADDDEIPRRKSYNACPDGRPIRGYDLSHAGVTHQDVVRLWDPDNKQKLLTGIPRSGGNGHVEFDLVHHLDPFNKVGQEYNARLVCLEVVVEDSEDGKMETKRLVESEQLYIVERIGRYVNGKLVAQKPEIVTVTYDG